MKRIISYLLAAVLVVSIMAGAGGTAFAAEQVEASDTDLQLTLIYTQLSKLKQDGSQTPWYYTVTDLDHDGNLEFVAATFHPQDRSTNLKIWELGADRQTLNPVSLDLEEDESFPEIMTDAADAYHDVETDTWFYMLYDNVVISDSDVYTVKTAVNLKKGVIGYEAFAVQHTVVNGVNRSVSYTDARGIAISPEQYNAAGNNAFAGTERTSVNFEWLTEDDLASFSRLIDSYAVFAGVKEPTEVFPVPRPAALQEPQATSAPRPTPTPTRAPEIRYLAITKNPTNENRKAGETALFVACANAYESLSWTFVAPNGGEYSVANFRNLFAAKVTGEYSTTIGVEKVTADMNGWGAYCTFYYKGQTQRTTTAYMYVKAAPAAQPSSGVYNGTVTDWTFDYIRVNLDGVNVVGLPYSICSVTGDLYVGAPATVYWTENASKSQVFTSCVITGRQPAPRPIYGSMSGTAYEGGAGYALYLADGSEVFVDAWICNVSGVFYDGAPCTVYYTYIPDSDNIYQVDIFGSAYVPDPAPVPVTPDPVPVIPDPAPAPVEPDPDPVPVEPDPDPMPVEPQPDPMPVDPEPDPVPVDPEPDPMPVEPDPAPVPVEPEPDPVPAYEPYYGTINARAFDNLDGRVVLYLDNGNTVYVKPGICNFYNELVVAGGGNRCIVHYVDSPTQENIYSVDVYEAEG